MRTPIWVWFAEGLVRLGGRLSRSGKGISYWKGKKKKKRRGKGTVPKISKTCIAN